MSPSPLHLRLGPSFELGPLKKKIDFFPPPRASWDGVKSICIATKSRSLGDALALTTLPRKLKEKYPAMEIFTYPRGFNPVVFHGNPHVKARNYLPHALYGDDCNLDSGQLIEQKESFFGLRDEKAPRPEIFLSDGERSWARRFVRKHTLPENGGKPLCILHPWGQTNSKVMDAEFWDSIVKRWNGRIRFWQVGIEGQAAIQGCEYYNLTSRDRWQARKLFALAAEAQLFLGVDSGPMHVARAFGTPSLVLLAHLQGATPRELFDRRRSTPYFLHGNWRYSPLYEENTHLAVNQLALGELHRKTDDFFEMKMAESTGRLESTP